MTLSTFQRFVSGQTATYLSYHMLSVVIGWQAYDLTGSPLVLGLVGLMQFLPQFLLTLAAGHVADSHDRRRITASCQIIGALLSALLSLGSLAGIMNEHVILAAACLVGAARAFEYPTMQALLPTLVEAGELPKCLAVSAGMRQLGVILGPALGGALYIAGPGTAYAVCACFSLLAATAMLSIRSKSAEPRREPVSWRSVLEGLTYIRSRPEILGAISLDLFSVLLGGATALLPVFARDILAIGPWGLGLLRSAPAAGAVAMSIFLARHPLKRRVGRTMFLAVATFGLATVVFGLSRSFALSLAALIALGMADMVSVVVRSSLIQLETPNDKRGRVSAVNAVFIGTSNQLGEFESGLTAAWFGVVPAVVLGGVGTLLVVVLWMRLFPALLRRETLAARRS